MNPELGSTFMYLGFALLAITAILWATNRKLAAKTGLILTVLVICGGGILRNGLNPGIDLKGGISLLYEVDVPEDASAEDTLNQIIAVLRQRIDPNGVRNVVFRTEGHNRIEVQMPLAGPEVLEAREAYQESIKSLEGTTLSRDALDSAFRAEGAEQTKALEELAGDVPGRLDLLKKAAGLHAEYRQLAERYYEAKEDANRELELELSAKYDAAQVEYEGVVEQLMATSVSDQTLLPILEMPSKNETDAAGQPVPGTSARAKALAQLYSAMPDRKAQIEKIVEAYDAYQKVKGPLDDAEDLKRLMRGSGVLEFRITVETQEAPTAASLIRELEQRGPRSLSATSPYKWYPIHDPARFADSRADLESMLDDPRAWFAGSGLIGGEYGDNLYVLLWDTPERSITRRDRGWELTRAYGAQDQTGLSAVGFEMNEIGGTLMGELTKNNLKRRMAILLDGRVYSNPPTIQSTIRDSGIISGGRGGFSREELSYMTRTLGAGSLSAALSQEPISERTIGPALGADNLARGLESSVIALLLVAIFMMGYFFFAGFVADLALLANIVTLLGLFALGIPFGKQTFTMPGIAGVVLTIGMCVDANVLIFERIREELYAGRDMLTALRLGYEKAFSSIIDGNITNLIVCIILYAAATADVRGFAVTLGVGIVSTLFTSLFVTRVIFTWYYKVFGAKKMKMLPSSFPAVERFLTPSVDWVAKRRMFFTVSAIVMAVGVVIIFSRGGDLLDIEFRGGTEVEFRLADGALMKTADVRAELEDKLPSATIIAIDGGAEGANGFSVLTTDADSDHVSEVVRDAFGDKLDVQPAISFAGAQPGVAHADRSLPGDVVVPVTSPSLGQVIGEAGVTREVPDAVGGVAIVLRDLDPMVDVATLETRLREMRLQPEYEAAGRFRAPPRVYQIGPSSVVVVSSDPDIDYFEDEGTWRTDLARSEWNLVNDALGQASSLGKVTNFTPTVARTMTYNAIVAMLLSIIAIVAYIWLRFGSLRYGLAAIAALVHDVTIALGLIALAGLAYHAVGELGPLQLTDFKINMALIAALLTIIGYSLNDTIIVFDRIRENRGKLAVASPAIVNQSINQTISRSVITSGTTFLAVAVLYLDGGAGVHGFAFAMVVGILVGTYSSIAIAAPMLMLGTKHAGYRGEATESKPSGGSESDDDSRNEKSVTPVTER